jgi:2-polyprenyl-3-methyl-5-hydroxy-6-metoxy-1,4-benzoquinol methylase
MYDPSIYETDEWFESLAWQHQWIDKLVGWWVGHFGRPKTICDFGCGDGWWLKAFHEMGDCEVTGIELSEIATKYIPKQVQVVTHDLRAPLDLGKIFNHTICLEVVEHLPPKSSVTVAKTLVRHTNKTLLFSAAGPGQEGTGHINLKTPKQWRHIFKQHGLYYGIKETEAAKAAFANILNYCMDYLPNNMQVFVRP